jgi:hypothetical protein
MARVACLILITEDYGKQRPFYKTNSVNSFKKWHPDVDVIIAGDKEFNEVWVDREKKNTGGIARFLLVRNLFSKGYNKVIIIGADTITCARFDEFLNDDNTPILATLDYPYLFDIDFDVKACFLKKQGVFEQSIINSDCTCFNSPNIIDDIISLCKENYWHEQVAMTFIHSRSENLIRIVDFPSVVSPFFYNNSGKGGIGADCIRGGQLYFGFDGPKIGEFTPIKVWKPIGDKLYNHLGKHCKMFHFCTHNDDDGKTWFNDETVQFFKDHCDCNWDLEWIH